MDEMFGIVTAEHAYLHQEPGISPEQNPSQIEDEIFSGWAVRLFPETQKNGWIKTDTHYGYPGYMCLSALKRADREEIRRRQDKERFFRLGIGAADLLDKPKVQGLPRELLWKNAVVELLETNVSGDWSRIRTAAGQEGYVHAGYLQERKDDDGYLLIAAPGDRAYFRQRYVQNIADEDLFRDSLERSARAYLGTQYRWGGKSSLGLDCSGLVFMCYLENGVLIYRDANIRPDYPVRGISAGEMKKGDLIFFPGHVAMYLGEGLYIHSTAFARTPWVTVNSLKPDSALYRGDLAGRITGIGSIF